MNRLSKTERNLLEKAIDEVVERKKFFIGVADEVMETIEKYIDLKDLDGLEQIFLRDEISNIIEDRVDELEK